MDILTGNRELCIWIKRLDQPIDMYGFNNVASKITEYGYLPQFGLALIFDGLPGTIISVNTLRARGMFWFYDNATNVHTLTTHDGFKICDFPLQNRLYRCAYSNITISPMEKQYIREYFSSGPNRAQLPKILMPLLVKQSPRISNPVSDIDQNPASITRVPDPPDTPTSNAPGDFNLDEQADDAVRLTPIPPTNPNYKSVKEAKSLPVLKRLALVRRWKAALGWSNNMKQQFHTIDNLPFEVSDLERSDIHYQVPAAQVCGRIQKRPQLSSTNHQRPTFGKRVHCDIIPGEYYFWIFMVEDKYKVPFFRILKNGKSGKYLMIAIIEMVNELNMLSNEKVNELWSDNESVFRSLQELLRAPDLQIQWHHSASQDHSVYIENAKKIFNAMSRSMYAGQLFPVLPNTEEYFINSVIQNMSLMPNADTGPNATPYSKAHKSKPTYGMVSSYYGMPVVYYDPEETRQQKGTKEILNPTDTIGILPPLDSSNLKTMPSGELGIAVGRDWDSTPHTIWIYDLRSAEIINRSQWRETSFTQPQVDLVWKRKTAIDAKRKKRYKNQNADYYKLSTNDNNEFLIRNDLPAIPENAIPDNNSQSALLQSLKQSMSDSAIPTDDYNQWFETLISSSEFAHFQHAILLQQEIPTFSDVTLDLTSCNSQLSRKKAENKHGESIIADALTTELEQLLDTGTLLPPPKGIKFHEIVNGNDHYEEKQLLVESSIEESEIVYKDYVRARLTADGSKQEFNPTEPRSSPTVHNDSLILALHSCSLKKWHLSSADIKGAYLKVDITKRAKKIGLRLRKSIADILIRLKPEWQQYQKPDGSIIVLLGTALYGLVDSGALWYDDIHNCLIEFGFERSPIDKCLYKYSKQDGHILLPLFVDDILVIASNLKLRARFLQFLEAKYGKLKQQTGPVIKHLGVRIDYDQSTGLMKLDQSEFLHDLFKKFPTKGTASTPSTISLFRRSDLPADCEAVDRKYYLSMLMSIAFVVIRTRLDYCKEIGWLAQSMAAPTVQDQRNLDRLYMNAKHTVDLVRTIAPTSFKLEAYVDTSHAIHTNFRGHTGIVIKMGGSTLIVYSKAQTLNSHSSCETELIGLDTSTTKVQPWIYHFEWLAYHCKPVTVFQDNKSVIRMTDTSFQQTSKSKHIGIRFFYVQNLVANGIIKIEYRNTKEMWADILTKPLSGRLYIKMRNAILNVT